DEEALTPAPTARIAGGAHGGHSFADFKAKGGGLGGDTEMGAAPGRAQRFPDAPSRLIRTVLGRWRRPSGSVEMIAMSWSMPKILVALRRAIPAARSWPSFGAQQGCPPPRI